MPETVVKVGKTGRLMSAKQFISFVKQQLSGCGGKYVYVAVCSPDVPRLLFKGSVQNKPTMEALFSWPIAGFRSPEDAPMDTSNSLKFAAIVLDKSQLSEDVLAKMRSGEFRSLGERARCKKRDLEICRKHHGEILGKADILKLFGYSPATYIFDTAVMNRELVIQVGKDKFKIISPEKRRLPC
jgi:hypothetical protein